LVTGLTLSEATCPAPNLFLLTKRNPPSNMIRASNPRITANVTIAPITPATAFEIPPEEDDCDEADVDADAEEEEVVEAQTPVEFPHIWHQVAWSPIANLFISSTNVGHEITVSDWPNSGYAVRGFSDAVPLEKRKRIEISSADG